MKVIFDELKDNIWEILELAERTKESLFDPDEDIDFSTGPKMKIIKSGDLKIETRK